MLSVLYLLSVGFMYFMDWLDDTFLKHRNEQLCEWLVIHRPPPFYSAEEVLEVRKRRLPDGVCRQVERQ